MLSVAEAALEAWAVVQPEGDTAPVDRLAASLPHIYHLVPDLADCVGDSVLQTLPSGSRVRRLKQLFEPPEDDGNGAEAPFLLGTLRGGTLGPAQGRPEDVQFLSFWRAFSHAARATSTLDVDGVSRVHEEMDGGTLASLGSTLPRVMSAVTEDNSRQEPDGHSTTILLDQVGPELQGQMIVEELDCLRDMVLDRLAEHGGQELPRAALAEAIRLTSEISKVPDFWQHAWESAGLDHDSSWESLSTYSLADLTVILLSWLHDAAAWHPNSLQPGDQHASGSRPPARSLLHEPPVMNNSWEMIDDDLPLLAEHLTAALQMRPSDSAAGTPRRDHMQTVLLDDVSRDPAGEGLACARTATELLFGGDSPSPVARRRRGQNRSAMMFNEDESPHSPDQNSGGESPTTASRGRGFMRSAMIGRLLDDDSPPAEARGRGLMRTAMMLGDDRLPQADFADALHNSSQSSDLDAEKALEAALAGLGLEDSSLGGTANVLRSAICPEQDPGLLFPSRKSHEVAGPKQEDATNNNDDCRGNDHTMALSLGGRQRRSGDDHSIALLLNNNNNNLTEGQWQSSGTPMHAASGSLPPKFSPVPRRKKRTSEASCGADEDVRHSGTPQDRHATPPCKAHPEQATSPAPPSSSPASLIASFQSPIQVNVSQEWVEEASLDSLGRVVVRHQTGYDRALPEVFSLDPGLGFPEGTLERMYCRSAMFPLSPSLPPLSPMSDVRKELESSKPPVPTATAVHVHVYDVTQEDSIRRLNKVLANKHFPLKFGGVFHAGVEVIGEEWSFGYTPSVKYKAVNPDKPKMHPDHNYRQTVVMPKTKLSFLEIQKVINELTDEFHGPSYDLLRRNCCHFADEMCQRLGVGRIPAWVYRLARVGARIDNIIQAAQRLREPASNRVRMPKVPAVSCRN
ncbi:unnamed protein product [Polarella glacialis]|uniref:PPPDE domain-containing protein n=1 Tax=Polarella glacialis TaxID=89957 RepID=A0A813LK92_POLGL|nr:unnamed protein product [Polarella glacialis]CAE8736130.1 unnamed protein product [Polarella glacialis]